MSRAQVAGTKAVTKAFTTVVPKAVTTVATKAAPKVDTAALRVPELMIEWTTPQGAPATLRLRPSKDLARALMKLTLTLYRGARV